MNRCIEVDQLTFGYNGVPLLDAVSFTVRRGDFVAVIGSNGAGKSTLLKLLLGELPPQRGTISILGQPVHAFTGWTDVGYVPQNAAGMGNGFPATVGEVVCANLYSQIGPLRRARREHIDRARAALEQVDMLPYWGRLIGNLSGGQQQRVMLARVLAAQPQMLLLDEPTAGVDAHTTEALYALLEQLNASQGLTVLMVTHDIARASAHVTRTLCLEDGSMLELSCDQLAEELNHRHRHPIRACETCDRQCRFNGGEHHGDL